MATPKKQYPYAIIKDDGSYAVYDLTRDEYDRIKEGIFNNRSAIELSMGIIRLSSVYAVIKQKPQPEIPVTPKSLAEGDPTFLTEEEKQWLQMVRENGLDPEYGGYN